MVVFCPSLVPDRSIRVVVEVAGLWLSHGGGIFLVPIPTESSVPYTDTTWLW
jgi:hypothetical protein